VKRLSIGSSNFQDLQRRRCLNICQKIEMPMFIENIAVNILRLFVKIMCLHNPSTFLKKVINVCKTSSTLNPESLSFKYQVVSEM
jgi:hypothetical protein